MGDINVEQRGMGFTAWITVAYGSDDVENHVMGMMMWETVA